MRIPAAFCGVYGIRPTHGRVDLAGAMPMAPSFDTAGWFASGPGVFRRVGGVLLDGARVDAPVERLIVAEDAFAEADVEVATLLHEAMAHGASVLPAARRARVAPGGFDPWREAFRVIQGRETWQCYGDFVTQARPGLGPGIRERMDFARSVTAAEADAARRVHAAARAHVRGLLPPGTVMALPSAPCIAPHIDTPADALESFRVRVMRLTCIAGLSGHPQVSIPIGTLGGCPIGLSFIGWSGGDEGLLDLAVAMARHCGIAA